MVGLRRFDIAPRHQQKRTKQRFVGVQVNLAHSSWVAISIQLYAHANDAPNTTHIGTSGCGELHNVALQHESKNSGPLKSPWQYRVVVVLNVLCMHLSNAHPVTAYSRL